MSLLSKFCKILCGILAIVLVVTGVVAVFMHDNTTYRPAEPSRPFTEGWRCDDASVAFPLSLDGETTIVNTLPSVEEDAVLLIRCNYKFLTARVGDETVYVSEPASLGAVKTDVGHYLAMIPLRAEHSGRPIAITLQGRDSGYNTALKDISLTTTADFALQILREKTPYLVVAVALLIGAVACMVTWLVFLCRKKNEAALMPHFLLWAGSFAAALGVWIFTEPHLWAVVTGRFVRSGIINYLALMLLPLTLLGMLRSLSKKPRLSLDLLVSLASLEVIVELGLFLGGAADLTAMLLVHQLSCIAALAIFVAYLIFCRKDFAFGRFVAGGMTVALICAVVSTVRYFLDGDWLLWSLLAVTGLIGSVLTNTIVRLSKDVDEANHNQRYKKFALTDVMTGAGSRFAYILLGEKYRKEVPAELSLIFLDTNNLKETNDTLGHAAGDEILIATAECIREVFEDIGEWFRLGGDEFLVATTADHAVIAEKTAIFERLVDDWCGKYVDDLVVSYGVVHASDYPGLSLDELMKKADGHMYVHKHHTKKQSPTTE